MRKVRTTRVAAVFTSMAIMAGIGILQAAPASAAPTCIGQQICFFDDTYPGSNRFSLIASTTGCKNIGMGSNGVTMDNKTSYIANTNSHTWYVYKGPNCTVWAGQIYPNSTGVMNAEWNNVISSVQRNA
jgi:hypothetical protein